MLPTNYRLTQMRLEVVNMVNMDENCQFLKDLEAQGSAEGASKIALYNLAVSVGQVELFSKGIRAI